MVAILNASVSAIKSVMMNVSVLNVIINVTKIGIGVHGVVMIYFMNATNSDLINLSVPNFRGAFLIQENHALAKRGCKREKF